MGINKKYKNYKSFQYLDAGKDYIQYKLSKEIARVEPYIIPLSSNEEDRVNEILEKNVVISLHDHTFVLPENLSELDRYFRQNRISTAYEGLSASGLDAVFDGLLDGMNTITSRFPWKWNSVIDEIGMRLSDFAHQDFVIVAHKVEDIYKAHKEGKLAIILHLEGAAHIENEVDRVDILYGLGVRCMGLTYSESNAIGSGLREKNDSGITEFGYEVIERMNKIGMTIDLAHVGDKSSLDAIAASKTPVFITHAGARALWNTTRMKPDNVLQALAEKGGVIGIEAAPHTTLTEKHREHTIESVMEHFQYIEKLIGIDHVAFGPDTLFGDHVGLHHYFSKEMSITQTHAGPQFKEVPYVKGLENPSEFKNIIRWLVKNGYSDEEISKVIGKNVLRVLEATWK
jgi:membrane dipeptidase